jgi:hypothetical protein
MSIRPLLGGIALLVCALGQSTAMAALPPPPPPFDAGPEAFQARLEAEGPNNRVLNDMEIGARAFWKGDYATAKPALDEAIAYIDAVFDNNENAIKARKLWYDEGTKDFRGEPYERAMAYAYRGLIYLSDGDYENARAAFRRGLMQDAFAEEEQDRADFALLLFLDAWASHVNGDTRLQDETMQMLKALRPNFGGFGEKDDTLVLLETGQGPRKLGDGASHSYFVYRRGKPILENGATVMLGAAALPAYPMEDIYYQASTRGGREIDKILQGKAQIKAVTGGVGSFAADTVIALQNTNSTLISGNAQGILAGVAVGSIIVSMKTRPQADVRTWTSLPDTVHVLTMATQGQPQTLTAHFLLNGVDVADDKPIRCVVDARRKQLCLVRSR